MAWISSIFVAIVAIEHIYILILEMFLWTKPRARKVFGTSRQFAEETKALAANQGLYNGFLAVGLLWGLVHPNGGFGIQIQIFFLLCVLVAAIYGSVTAKRSILITQGLPACIAFVFVLIHVLQ
ncbi:DUF1304 domain-containing protein [Paenibacillus medicaginis]|uniref:DUF1304 domain-containing protein n=1 Tax=Paenibacillus medicaginis TaxID=1470560 RepID=A0ABV5C7X6_9BACL